MRLSWCASASRPPSMSESAVIAGVYEGSLKVSGHLEVASTGAIKGSVSYKTIMVANGGKLEGTIELT